ncbi:ferritin [Synechococcus sp. BIOS-E4-1]|uniref:ferritin n=1 Tax=Synechococcus sp. BIOS-E4-1 TaxID=1400864 RepID=UPI001648564A|nr:ferritin [Synechococcus sp. BIOS-E4-1]QNI53641.1 ferritin [Synechococcus sp. BIOS-E4-1]
MTNSATQATITIPVGPAGRAMAEPMSSELLDLMEAHLNLERQSAADYLAAAIWFAERELTGFAEHLRDEAKQEQEHAAKFADYLISRGQRPVLDTIEPPRQQWPDVEQVIANVFRMEADVTASVLQLYGTAEKDIDRRTTVFLDPIVDGQRLSEHEAAYLLGRVKFAAGNPAAVMIIDAELREGEAEPAKLEG